MQILIEKVVNGWVVKVMHGPFEQARTIVCKSKAQAIFCIEQLISDSDKKDYFEQEKEEGY